MRVLGVSAFYHDSAAALVRDGAVVAAAQEERFPRRRHDPDFPRNAIAYCLEEEGIGLDGVDHVVFYDKPFLKFERLVETYAAFAPRGFRSFRMAMPLWIREKLFLKRLLVSELEKLGAGPGVEKKLLFTEHHLSHAASAFFPSPFAEAAVLCLDGVGEWATTSLSMGRGSELEGLKEIHFPHSLGLLYSAFTHHTGFRVNSGEYKVMGLAPYGTPRFAQVILDQLIDLKPDGSFRLELRYFDYCTGLRMTSPAFDALFGPARRPEEPLTQREMDLAASIQAVLEEAVLRMARSIRAETGARNLCLAGGVALNCVANARILREGLFDGVWIQPAAGDAGGALGAALAAYHLHAGQPRTTWSDVDGMMGALLGPGYTQEEIERQLAAGGARFTVLDDEALIAASVDVLAAGQALGWFQGRMEFGPRALGGRSILADPRAPEMQSVLNLKVKHRESFRPFAPSVLREQVGEWFDFDGDTPYMLLVADVAAERRIPASEEEEALAGVARLRARLSQIPAVTHVDGSARLQTVRSETSPRYHAHRLHAGGRLPLLHGDGDRRAGDRELLPAARSSERGAAEGLLARGRAGLGGPHLTRRGALPGGVRRCAAPGCSSPPPSARRQGGRGRPASRCSGGRSRGRHG